MNILMIPGCDNSGQDTAESELLNRSLLFNDESEVLFIKENDHLIPIGGSAKQNKLVAGDNIEIAPEDDTDPYSRDVIRMSDDVVVRTLTIRPDAEVPDWKGTYKVGELHDGNQVFLITKATEVLDETQGIFGGTLLVKMVADTSTETDKEIYAEYAVTLTSTGSWSLEGGTNFGLNVRVCKARYLNQEGWMYGLKLPEGRFKNHRIIDNPTIEEVDLSSSINIRAVDDETFELYNTYGSVDLENVSHIRDYSHEAGDGFSRDLWVCDIDDYKTIAMWDSNNPAVSFPEDDVLECDWRDWVGKDYKLGITLDTKYETIWEHIVHSTSRSISLYRDTSTTGSSNRTDWHQNGKFHLRAGTYGQGSGLTAYRDISLTAIGNDDTLYGGGASSWNHWYACSLQNFFRLAGMYSNNTYTVQGDWANYIDNISNYRFALRIFMRDNSVRITVMAILDPDNNQVHIIGSDDKDIEFNWESDVMNFGQSLYPNFPPDHSEEIFRFIDRTDEGISHDGVELRAISVQILDEDLELVDTPSFSQFDRTWWVANESLVNDYPNNKNPIFVKEVNGELDGAYPRLILSSEEGVNDNLCTSRLGAQDNHYRYITRHNYSEEEFWDTLRVKDAEFWFNGWNDIPESLRPTQVGTSSLEYQILAKESQDEDSFSEIFVWDGDMTVSNLITKIDSLQKLGEDAPPYKFVVSGRALTLTDLRNLGNALKMPDRQVWLDLSECWMANNNQNLNTPVFEGCSSLRGIVMPQRITRISTGIFIWCTYLRHLDLSPSFNTLTRIGNSGNSGTDWNQNIGTFTSTRIKTLILPKGITNWDAYIVYSSNIQNFIWLGDENTNWPRTQETVSQRTFGGIPLGTSNDVYSGVLPRGFHCFLEQRFYNRHPTDWLWNNSSGWYTQDFVNSIVTYNRDWTQEQWQNFNDSYNWGEELINQIRQYWGKTDYIEIQENF